MTLTVPPRTTHGSFMFSQVHTDLDTLDADIAILGLPYGSAYWPEAIANPQIKAPDAVRQASYRACQNLDRYDYDLGGPLFDNRPVKMVDVGDVVYDISVAGGDHFRRAEIAMRKILKAGALPITIGGDHGIPIPIFRALEELGQDEGPITLIQIDAHIDWRDERNGVYDGLSSPIRRASELPHIGDIFQIGMRAQGSARPEEVEAAAAYGVNIITAFEVHQRGIQAILDQIPDKGRYYITVDADGLDPSICPAVETPCPGGLSYLQVRELINGLVTKGRVVGMDIVEICPELDLNDLTSVVACRLITNLVGTSTRAGYFDKTE